MRSPLFARFRRGWLVGAVAALVISAGAVIAPQPSASAGSMTNRVLEFTNAERAKYGLAPVIANPNLTLAAQSYADVLASTGCWSHSCPPLTSLSDRSEAAGYQNWISLGENLAAGSSTPEGTFDAWLQSPAHRAAILNPAYTEVGVAISFGGPQRIYWTQEFGARGLDNSERTESSN